MLRITTHNSPEHLTFQLEGRLAGPWVLEMIDCWSSVVTGQRLPEIRVDLAGLIFVDAAGKSLLGDLHANGAELIAADCLMKSVVEEIKTGQPVVADIVPVPARTEEKKRRSRRRRRVAVPV